MHAFVCYWVVAFVALLLAVLISAIFYRSINDGLDLNGWLSETITALAVSAAQAGGYVLQQHFPMPPSHPLGNYGNGDVAGSIFLVSLWLGYKITHLTTWDSMDYLVLCVADTCIAGAALLAFS